MPRVIFAPYRSSWVSLKLYCSSCTVRDNLHFKFEIPVWFMVIFFQSLLPRVAPKILVCFEPAPFPFRGIFTRLLYYVNKFVLHCRILRRIWNHDFTWKRADSPKVSTASPSKTCLETTSKSAWCEELVRGYAYQSISRKVSYHYYLTKNRSTTMFIPVVGASTVYWGIALTWQYC